MLLKLVKVKDQQEGTEPSSKAQTLGTSQPRTISHIPRCVEEPPLKVEV